MIECKKAKFTALAIAVCVTLTVTGCVTPPEPPPPVITAPPVPPPPPPAPRPGEVALAEGVDLHHQGNYPAAIKKLQDSADIWIETQAIRIEASKYIAFAACSSSPARTALCRQYFERILDIDPNFELSSAEKDHPVWGAIFRQVKQARATRRPAR